MKNVMMASNVAISGRLEDGTCSKFNAVGEYINPQPRHLQLTSLFLKISDQIEGPPHRALDNKRIPCLCALVFLSGFSFCQKLN